MLWFILGKDPILNNSWVLPLFYRRTHDSETIDEYGLEYGTRNGGQFVTVPGPVSVCHTVTRLVTTDGRPSRHIMNKCKNSKTVNIIIRLGPPVQ